MALLKFGVGQAVARREDDGLLAGRAQFVDDVAFGDALHMVLVRSPHPHARPAPTPRSPAPSRRWSTALAGWPPGSCS
jgi:CO/xanthine dehydrogenase Mo-binding subunit